MQARKPVRVSTCLPPTHDVVLVHHLAGEALLVEALTVNAVLHGSVPQQAVDVGGPGLAIAEDASHRLQDMVPILGLGFSEAW